MEDEFPKSLGINSLRAMMSDLPGLLPRVEMLARRYISGHEMAEREQEGLLSGLIVLAAARAHAFWRTWVALLMAWHGVIADPFYDFRNEASVTKISLGLVGNNTVDMGRLAALSFVPRYTRIGLVQALARLTCEGRYPRAEFIGLRIPT